MPLKRTGRRVQKRKIKINRESFSNVGVVQNLTNFHPKMVSFNPVDSFSKVGSVKTSTNLHKKLESSNIIENLNR